MALFLCSPAYVFPTPLQLTDFGLSRFFETRPPAPEDVVEDSHPLPSPLGADAKGDAKGEGSPRGDGSVNMTRSFCGTEQYMSPEMLLQQGHSFRMDWWCVGLLMHEMLTARHPFHGQSVTNRLLLRLRLRLASMQVYTYTHTRAML